MRCRLARSPEEKATRDKKVLMVVTYGEDNAAGKLGKCSRATQSEPVIYTVGVFKQTTSIKHNHRRP